MWVAVGISNYQNASFRVSADGHPAFFVMIVVLYRQGRFVVEHGFCVGQADAFVLLLIGDMFRFIKLNPERSNYAYFICIKKPREKPSVRKMACH